MAKKDGNDDHDYREGWRHAAELAAWLRDGGQPPTVATPLVLAPGEVVHATAPVEVAMYHGMDVEYGGGAFVGGASWKGFAATAAASAMYNSHQRRKAESQSMAQWRSYGVQWVTVTSTRFLFMVEGEMIAYGLYDGTILAFEPNWQEFAATLHVNGGSPIGMRGPGVPYLSVLLSSFLFRQIPELTP